jgi:Stress responsive A/B Barrel Domain
MIYHVVLFSLTEDSQPVLADLLERLKSVQQLVPDVRSVWAGENIGAGKFDAALIVALDNRAALQAYREHPAHRPIADDLRRCAARLEVVDFES